MLTTKTQQGESGGVRVGGYRGTNVWCLIGIKFAKKKQLKAGQIIKQGKQKNVAGLSNQNQVRHDVSLANRWAPNVRFALGFGKCLFLAPR